MGERGPASKVRLAFLNRLDAALDGAAVTRRGRFWARLLRRASPGNPGDLLSYLSGAALDTWRYVGDREANPVPRSRRPLTLVLRDSGLRFEVREDTDDVLHVMPGREQDVHDAILGSLRPGDTFVDVGANIGYYSVLAGVRVTPEGSVTAVEAVPTTAEVLRRNLLANGLTHVRVVGAAVAPPGVDRATIRFDPRHMGRAALGGEAGQESHEVPATTLDEVCGDLGPIRLIKIDVEGAELVALEGAVRTLERTDAVVLECNEDGPAVERFLERHGFVVSRLRFTNHRLARKG